MKESYLVLLLVGHESSSSTSAQEARYTRGRGAGLGSDMMRVRWKIPGGKSLLAVGAAKVTLKRLVARWDALQPWMITASTNVAGEETLK